MRSDGLTVTSWPRTEHRSRCAEPIPRLRGADVGWAIVFFFWLFHLLIWAWYELFCMRRLPITQPVPENRTQARLPGFRVRCCSARFSQWRSNMYWYNMVPFNVVTTLGAFE
jgi:hypothetical protein